MELTDYKPAAFWLDQFNRQPEDRELAAHMLKEFRYISNVDLASDLTILLERNIPRLEMAALYVERELQTTRRRKPAKMYKEIKVTVPGRRKKALRAKGAAQPVVRSLTNNQQQVGSEGVIAQQLTQLCKKHRRRFLLHPSAEMIRSKRARHLVIVTDFVGSGNRIYRMLNSLWQVRSVRSWHSLQFIRVWVVCYSGSPAGLSYVKKHPSRPKVLHVLPCPTLESIFDTQSSNSLKDLCCRYGKFHKRPLGYDDVGALIAFEHGCPNNSPAVFIETSSSHKSPWQPLFEKCSTIQLARAANHEVKRVETLVLETLRYPNIATSPSFIKASCERRNVILLLAALSQRHRHFCELVGILQMPLWELSAAFNQATELDLVDSHNRLTNAGRQELRKLVLENVLQPMALQPKSNYYPTMLRAPC